MTNSSSPWNCLRQSLAWSTAVFSGCLLFHLWFLRSPDSPLMLLMVIFPFLASFLGALQVARHTRLVVAPAIGAWLGLPTAIALFGVAGNILYPHLIDDPKGSPATSAFLLGAMTLPYWGSAGALGAILGVLAGRQTGSQSGS